MSSFTPLSAPVTSSHPQGSAPAPSPSASDELLWCADCSKIYVDRNNDVGAVLKEEQAGEEKGEPAAPPARVVLAARAPVVDLDHHT